MKVIIIHIMFVSLKRMVFHTLNVAKKQKQERNFNLTKNRSNSDSQD